MITSFEVGAVFKIINEASPALKQILKQVRELREAIDAAKLSLDGLGKNLGLSTAIGETSKLATEWTKVDVAITRANASMNASGAAARRASAGIATGGGGGGGGGHRPGWLGGGGGGGGVHYGASGVAAPGGHFRMGGVAGGIAAAVGYAGYEAANYDDAVVFMAQHAGVDLKENRAKFRKMLTDATSTLGYSEKDVSLAAQQELRMFGDTGGSNGVNVLPKMLRYAATEARLKGTSLEESMTSLTGLAHMVQAYGEDDVDRLAPAFSALSVRSPMTLAQQERAFGYAVPILHASMGLDPMQVMASSVALARAGITNTKAGTWVRQMMTNAMPGTNMMTKMLYKKHEAALKELGLVDDQNNPTWFSPDKTGKMVPDEMHFLANVAEALPKIDIKRRAAVLQGLAGTQGAGALAVLSEPAVQPQITRMYEEMRNPENVNRVRNFMTVYGEQSTVQNARTTLQTFNVMMADLGDKILPGVNIALHDFKGVLEAIRSVIPGANGGATVGARVIEGALGGAAVGFGYGAIGGPWGAGAGALGGAIVGGVEGVAEQYMSGHHPRDLNEVRARREAVVQPISFSLNIDGTLLGRVLSNISTYSFEGQSSAHDGLGGFQSPNHQDTSN